MTSQQRSSNHSTPALDKPYRGWVRDLQLPDDSAASPKRNTPIPVVNSMNGIYLELSRRNTMRGLLLFLAIFPFIWMFFAIPFLLIRKPDLSYFLMDIPCFLMALWITALTVRIDISTPSDEPIRFNRLRRNVYVNSFHHIWWKPWSRWHVTTKVYPWQHLRAEVWSQRGATGQGGLIFTWGVSIAVVKPGTNQVIDRFPLSVGQDEGSSWDYVRAYMQHGPDALPPVDTFNDPNEVPPYNLALRLAPKVGWPAQIDAESRSGQDDPAIAQNAN